MDQRDKSLFGVVGLAAAVAVLGTLIFLATSQKAVAPSADRPETDESSLVEAGFDRGGGAMGVDIVPVELLEDSRCPVDVQCIWAGTVRVKTRLTSGAGEAEQDFTLGEPVTTDAATVTLERVEPEPRSTVKIELSDYSFFFKMERATP